jgi:hypothetical protein
VREEELRVEARRIDSLGAKVVRGPLEDRGDGPDLALRLGRAQDGTLSFVRFGEARKRKPWLPALFSL